METNLALDRIALQDVMLNYAAAVDERDYDRYKACFATNVEVVNFGEEIFRGRDAWLEYVWGELKKYSATQHLLGPQYAIVEGDNARTRSDVQALHFTEGDKPQRVTLWATYQTDMQRIAGDWKIVRHELAVRGLHRS